MNRTEKLKKSNKILFLFLSLFLLTSSQVFAQNTTEIKGYAMEADGSEILPFAIVEVIQNDSVIKRVEADVKGNFVLHVPQGDYTLRVHKNKYETFTTHIHTSDDDDLYIAAKLNDYVAPANTTHLASKGKEDKDKGRRTFYSSNTNQSNPMFNMSISGKHETSVPETSSSSDGGGAATGSSYSGSAGVLTAGELNDYHKWDLWSDLADGEFAGFSENWKMQPETRHTIQILNEDSMPVIDEPVELIAEGKVIWTARTDNTGKAELWNGFFYNEIKKKAKFRVQGKTYRTPLRKNLPKLIYIDQSCDQPQVLDIAFITDATGSMGDELEYLKNEMQDVIGRVAKANKGINIRVASVFYRDQGDDYVTKKEDFTSNLRLIQGFINDQSAGGGGDYPEAVDVALSEAINLSWSNKAVARIAFLILDAPPHENPATLKKLQHITRRAAQRGIKIIPITASGINKSTEFLMRSLALGTNGTYVFLTDDSGIGGSHIKPSTDSYEVEKFNALLARLVGQYVFIPGCQSENIAQVADSVIQEKSVPLPEASNPLPKQEEKDEDEPHYAQVTEETETKPEIEEEKIFLKIYPNPTRGRFKIESSHSLDVVFIGDISGKVMNRWDNVSKTARFNLEHFPPGIYTFKYQWRGNWYYDRLVIEK